MDKNKKESQRNMKSGVLLLLLVLASSATAARILAVLPFFVRSHFMFFQGILKALDMKGHELVVYSSLKMGNHSTNYTEILLETSFNDDFVTYDAIIEILNESPIAGFAKIGSKLDPWVEEVINHQSIQQLLRSDEKFDLVLTEAFVSQEAFLVFGHIFNAPNIVLMSSDTPPVLNWIMGNSLSLSYIPDWTLDFSDEMTFYQRAINSYSILKSIYSFHQEQIPRHQEKLDRLLGRKKAPRLEDLLQNISMLFSNRHPTSMYAQPCTPNIISLGGIHISTERSPLKQDIKRFMDEAEHGVIYFSLGTLVPEHQMPREFYNKFVSVFKTLPQRVLWKLRSQIEGLPANVMTAQWIQQQDVLEHPNCVLFMTHGGLLSQLEAVRAGVPVIGMPFLGDQPQNVRFYERKGIGLKLDFLTLSEEKISNAIRTVISDTKYRSNAKQLSLIARDLPMSQADSAVFWVEYVLRHAGAHHLRPASTSLAWYQLALADVLAAVLLLVVAALVVIYYLTLKVLSLLFSSKKGSSKATHFKKNK